MDLIALEKHDQKDYFIKVYFWMFIGMLLSGMVAYYIMINMEIIYLLSDEVIYKGVTTERSTFYWAHLISHILVPLTINITNIIQYCNWFFTMIFYFFLCVLTIGVNVTLMFFRLQDTFIIYILFIIALSYLLAIIVIYIKQSILSKKQYLLFIGILSILFTIGLNYYLNKNLIVHIISIFLVYIFIKNTSNQIETLEQNNTINDMYTENHLKESFHGAIKIVVEFLEIFINILISIASWNYKSPSNTKARYNITTKSDISDSSNFYH